MVKPMDVGAADKRDLNAGFRRLLYDAMVLSTSIRVIRACRYYRRNKAADIDGDVEAHQANALIQIRSMIDFLTSKSRSRSGKQDLDTMTVDHFPGCTKQSIQFREQGSTNKYVAHKSWAAVKKDAGAGAPRLRKSQIVKLGSSVLDGFVKFWKQHEGSGAIRYNKYARRYKVILEENLRYIRQNSP